MPLIQRSISKNILEALQEMPVVFVNGPRQAGKSTLVQKLAESKWPATYVTFDEPSQFGAAQANPEIFLRSHDNNLIIDEVQMVPDLFRVLKMLVDELRLKDKNKAHGHYLLTGSTNIMALPGLADALVGRMAVITLYPLSAVEIAQSKGLFLKKLFDNGFKPQKQEDDDVIKMIYRATFPEVTDQNDQARHRWFESHIMTILQRDVRQIADIEKLGVLPNLLRILASRAGCLINEADIARSLRQNAVTTKNYRLLLQMMFLVFDLKPWFRNIGKRLVKSSKGYMTDTSLLCHLQQIDLKSVAVKDPAMFGHVLENFVASELLKQLTCFEYQTDLLHFRTSDNKEVDFILQQSNGTLAGVEVKGSDNVNNNDFKGLRELQAQTGEDFTCGVVLYRGKNTISFGEKLWAMPMSMLWA
jgi:predicted AAA+ superfamily ATPase